MDILLQLLQLNLGEFSFIFNVNYFILIFFPFDNFRPSLDSSNDLVRRVEAALAGAEPLLTPPRSSPESPDRSSSPESDSILMADRDIMSLPPRKRKLYLKDNQSESSTNSQAMRMSSVIQFAKAS